MNNIILILKSIYNEDIRIDVNSVETYQSNGTFSRVRTKSGETLDVLNTVQDLDKAFKENYYMVKKVLINDADEHPAEIIKNDATTYESKDHDAPAEAKEE